MPVLKEVQLTNEQVLDLFKDLPIQERISLLLSAIGVKRWKEVVYAYAEKIAREKGIDKLTEEDIEKILHDEKSSD